jgi:hypothetical protein
LAEKSGSNLSLAVSITLPSTVARRIRAVARSKAGELVFSRLAPTVQPACGCWNRLSAVTRNLSGMDSKAAGCETDGFAFVPNTAAARPPSLNTTFGRVIEPAAMFAPGPLLPFRGCGDNHSAIKSTCL